MIGVCFHKVTVSTHSRPKAAGPFPVTFGKESSCFNTQPPEGGWVAGPSVMTVPLGFNTQPPEGGWGAQVQAFCHSRAVSTHSRPKAAGSRYPMRSLPKWNQFQHTAARRRLAADELVYRSRNNRFNTQPPEGGWDYCANNPKTEMVFQHTAARRRLV